MNYEKQIPKAMSKEYNEWYWKFYRWIKWELPYQHKYIKYGVKNLYRWFWTIWKDRDWDHYYIFEVLKLKLKNQANYLSKYGDHESSDRDAELIMTCVRLIDKIQNESYNEEFYDAELMSTEKFQKVINKQNKAKRILFGILNDKIERWWN